MAIVDRAVQAIGGRARLDALGGLTFEFAGESAATFQGLNPGSPHRMLPRSGNLVIDRANGRMFVQSETRWPNFTSSEKVLIRDGKSHSLDDSAKTYRVSNNDETLTTWELRLVPFVLKRLIADPTGMIDLGTRAIDGTAYDAVAATLGTGKVRTIYFSKQTGLPAMTEHLDYSSDFGDLTVRQAFSGYSAVSGLMVPSVVKTFNNGQQVGSVELKNLTLDSKDKAAYLDLPADFRPAGERPAPPKMNTREIAAGVYLIENIADRDYNVMFADLGDSIMIFEAPVDLWVSKIALVEIKKIFPDKPVRSIMVTHFHDDHAAGIRTYMSEGLTVVTTPGNEEYFRGVADLRHDFHRENKLLNVSEKKFELVRDGFHEIKGKTFSVQFIEFGPTPHVDENIVAYIPEFGVLFQGDYFRVPQDRSRPEPIRNEGAVLLRKLKERKLEVKQLVGAHGAIGTIADLEKALAARNARDQARP